MQNEVTSYRFSFPSFIRDEFDKKFARLNKKLAKMPDGEEVSILSEEFETRKILKPEARDEVKKTSHLKSGHPKKYVIQPEDYMDVVFTQVEVSLPSINKIKGFSFVGTINLQKDPNGNEVKTIYAVDDSVNLAEVDTKFCHHCNTKRTRKAVFVFNEVSTGDMKAVGSTCVHEYLGVDIYPVLHTFFNFYKEDDFYGSNAMRTAWGYPIVELANAVRVAYTIRPDYVKAGDSRYGEYNENNTKSLVDHVHSCMYRPNQYTLVEGEGYLETLKSAPKVGNLLKTTYEDMDATASNFNANIVETLFYTNPQGDRVLRDFIVGKARGVFVWACYNALKKSQAPVAPKASTPTQTSNHVGKIGERIEVSDVSVTFTKVIDGYYGESRMVKFQDGNGNQFVTFGTGNDLWRVEVGEVVTLKGTVSKHDDYKGVAQTCLKRVSLKETACVS